jgi:glycosyltransferase involved in cell wall biosynthesis
MIELTQPIPNLNDLPPAPAGKSGWPWTVASTQLPSATPGGRSWPRITVVTPSYNQADFIEATIRSVLLQGYPELEYIIIDGGSTDGSREIIDCYRPWLSYAVSEPDDGQYAAINKGFAQSTGSILSWLNSDDMYMPNGFWAVGGAFADLSGKVTWVTGIPAMTDRYGNLATVLPRPRLSQLLLRIGAYDGVTLNFIQQEGTFWSRALWERAGAHLDSTFDLAADYDLWCRFADHAPLYGVSAVLAAFRRHAHQKTGHSMLAYTRQMERCRAGRKWGSTERHWLARGLKRRLARLIYRLGRDENLVVYSPSDLRWEIIP